MAQQHRSYPAFISYRHADNEQPGRQWATWLHQAIETYEVPSELVGRTNGRGETIPERVFPVFRDELELPANADLGQSITLALDHSDLLIVLCSPRSVQSTYVADEIDYFKKQGKSDRIIAAIIDGEPNTSWDKAKLASGFSQSDECFPLPLQFEYNELGQRTGKRAEPIAADFRVNVNGHLGQGWTNTEALKTDLKENSSLHNKDVVQIVADYQQQLDLMLLKIMAGILGVPLGELTARDKAHQLALAKQRATKLRRWLTAITVLAIVAVVTGLYAIQKRDLAQQAEQVAVASQARSTMKLMVENWQTNQSPQSLLGIGGVIDHDVAKQASYRTIFADLSQSMLTIEQAVSKLSTEVFIWNGNTYVSLNGKLHQVYPGEAISYATTANLLIVVLPNRGVLVWDKNTRRVKEFDDYRPMNTVIDIYENERHGMIFVLGAYIGATGGSTGCRSFSTYVKSEIVNHDETSAATVECLSGLEVTLPTGELSDWTIITQTPDRLSFPAISNKVFASDIASQRQQVQSRCSVTDRAYCETEQQQSLADALVTQAKREGVYGGMDTYVEFRQQFHFLYSVDHGNSAREEQLCIHNQIYRPCISWSSVTNEGFNDSNSAVYFSDDGNLIVIIGGGGSFGDEVIVFHFDRTVNEYQRLKINSLPFNELYVGAAVANSEQFVVAVENRLWLYRVHNNQATRLTNVDIETGLAVAALDEVGVLSITTDHVTAEPDYAELSFEEFQRISQQYERNFWLNLQEANWAINLHDFNGNLVWSSSLSQSLINYLTSMLKLKSEERWGASIYYPLAIEVGHLKSEHKLFVKLMDKVIIIDELFGYYFGELAMPKEVSLNKTVNCSEGKRCVLFNDELLLLQPSDNISDISQIVNERLGHINSDGVRVLTNND